MTYIEIHKTRYGCWEVAKACLSSHVPRVGEVVVADGHYLKVTEVIFDVDSQKAFIYTE